MTIADFMKELGVSGLDAAKARRIMQSSPYSKNINTRKDTIEGNVDEILAYVKSQLFEEEEAKQQAEEAEAALNAELASVLITSGLNFEGYRITRYSGYISGDDATILTRGEVFGDNYEQNISNAMVKIRRQALFELKQAAYDLGCNAVIGVDFDYMTFEAEAITGPNVVARGFEKLPYTICVTANGTAVEIEKE